MKTCEERRPDYRILFEIYTERIYKAISSKNLENLSKALSRLDELQEERRRRYFRKVYQKYIQKNHQKTYANVYLQKDWRGEDNTEEYIKINIEYAPYKIQKKDMEYISKHYNISDDDESDDESIDLNVYYQDEEKKGQCIKRGIIQTKSKDIETLKWLYDFTRNKEYQQIYKEMKFNLIDQITEMENTEYLDKLQQNFKFSYSNTDYGIGLESNRILYYSTAITSLLYNEESKKKEIYKWWKKFFSQDRDTISQQELGKIFNSRWGDQEAKEKMKRELQQCGWLQ